MLNIISNRLAALIWIIFIMVLAFITIVANIRFFEEHVIDHLNGFRVFCISAFLFCGILILLLSKKQLYPFFQNKILRVLSFISHNIYWFLIPAALLSLIVRIYWIYTFQVVGFEDDYLAYHDRASNYAQGNYPHDAFVGLFPHVFGFSYVLGIVYKLLGSTVIAAAVFNMFLLAVSIVLFILLYPPKEYPLRSLVVVTVFGLWPSLIYYVIVPNTEYLFMALWLFILLIQKYIGNAKSIGYEAGLSIILGIVLASSNFIRPVSNIIIIAFVMCLIFVMAGKQVGRKCLITVIMIAAFYSSTLLINYGISEKAQVKTASLPIGFALYVGTNPTPIGGELGLWNLDDAGKFSDMVNQYQDSQQSQYAALREGLARLQNIINTNQLPHFLYLKIRTAWGTDWWGIRYAAYQVETHPKYEESVVLLNKIYDFLIAIGDFIYTLFLIIVTVMVVRHFVTYRSHIRSFLAFNCALLVIGTFVMLLFVESDPRYHLPGLLAFIVIFAELCERPSNLIPVQKKERQIADV